jgi:hypothetical protein
VLAISHCLPSLPASTAHCNSFRTICTPLTLSSVSKCRCVAVFEASALAFSLFVTAVIVVAPWLLRAALVGGPRWLVAPWAAAAVLGAQGSRMAWSSLSSLRSDASARARLEAIWVRLGRLTSLAGVLALGTSAGLALTGQESSCAWLLVAVLNIPAGLLARNGRSRLARRSGPMLTAASIAAMLGGRSSADVQQLAARRFRSVTLQRLAFSDLADSQPSARLFALSRPALLGEVDAFLRCDEHPCDKCRLV